MMGCKQIMKLELTIAASTNSGDNGILLSDSENPKDFCDERTSSGTQSLLTPTYRKVCSLTRRQTYVQLRLLIK